MKCLLFHESYGKKRLNFVGAARLVLFLFLFPCSADSEQRDWPPCKVVFFGLSTNALNVRNNNVGDKEEMHYYY